MAKRKLSVRRSISVPAEVMWRLRQVAELGVAGDNPTQVVENAINKLADQHGVPTVSRDRALKELPRKPQSDPQIISQHFTF